jgi:cytochrome c1
MWRRPRLPSGCVAAVVSALLAGCAGPGPRSVATVAGGDAARGARAIGVYGCGYCHVIPSVHGATGTAAPPLASFGTRTTIAGDVANTPDQLVAWIMNPQGIKPRTGMPNLGVRAADARDIAAYLYTLR